MTFANPVGAAAAAAQTYVRALLDLLGDQDPFEIAAEQLPWLERRTARLDDATLRRAGEDDQVVSLGNVVATLTGP